MTGAALLYDYLPLAGDDYDLAAAWMDYHLPFTRRDMDLPSAGADVQCSVRVDFQHPVQTREFVDHSFTASPVLTSRLWAGRHPVARHAPAENVVSAPMARSSRSIVSSGCADVGTAHTVDTVLGAVVLPRANPAANETGGTEQHPPL